MKPASLFVAFTLTLAGCAGGPQGIQGDAVFHDASGEGRDIAELEADQRLCANEARRAVTGDRFAEPLATRGGPLTNQAHFSTRMPAASTDPHVTYDACLSAHGWEQVR